MDNGNGQRIPKIDVVSEGIEINCINAVFPLKNFGCDQQCSAIFASCGFHLSQQSHILQTLAPIFKMAGADENEVERFLLQANGFLIMALLKSVKGHQRKRKHKFWVRKVLQKRNEFGAFHTLTQELRLLDREYFFR